MWEQVIDVFFLWFLDLKVWVSQCRHFIGKICRSLIGAYAPFNLEDGVLDVEKCANFGPFHWVFVHFYVHIRVAYVFFMEYFMNICVFS